MPCVLVCHTDDRQLYPALAARRGLLYGIDLASHLSTRIEQAMTKERGSPAQGVQSAREAMTVRKNYYYILGLSTRATERDIKRAYHQLVQQYHPDHDPSTRAQRQFKEITEAYEVLSDPVARAEFDSQMKLGRAADLNEPVTRVAEQRASRTDVHFDLHVGIGRMSLRVKLNRDASPDTE